MRTNVSLCLATVLAATSLALPAAEGVEPAANRVAEGLQPQAALSEDGIVHLTFGAGNSVYYTQSGDKGRTFQEPVKLGDIPGLALGMRRGPRIIAGQGSLVVSAIGHHQGNLLAWRSGDGGKHWSRPTQVNDVDGKAVEGLHAMTLGPAGQVFCTWLDLRQSGTQLWSALSTDGGKTWQDNRQVYASPSGSICECCHPSATYAADGTLYVMWRNSLDGYRDMFITSSPDNGRTFSQARKLGHGSWHLAACPMDGGHLAVTGGNQLTTVWRRDREVFRADGPHDEQLLGTGQQPWSAATDEGVHVAWITKRDGELKWSSPKGSEPTTVARRARDPVIVASPSQAGPVILFWETGERQAAHIMAAVLPSL